MSSEPVTPPTLDEAAELLRRIDKTGLPAYQLRDIDAWLTRYEHAHAASVYPGRPVGLPDGWGDCTRAMECECIAAACRKDALGEGPAVLDADGLHWDSDDGPLPAGVASYLLSQSAPEPVGLPEGATVLDDGGVRLADGERLYIDSTGWLIVIHGGGRASSMGPDAVNAIRYMLQT